MRSSRRKRSRGRTGQSLIAGTREIEMLSQESVQANALGSQQTNRLRSGFFAITRPLNDASVSLASASHLFVPTCISRVFWPSSR